MITPKEKNGKIYTNLVMIFFILMFIAQVFDKSAPFFIGYVYFAIALLTAIIIIIRSRKISIKQVSIILFWFLFMIVSYTYNNNMNIRQIIFYLQYISITYVLWNVKLNMNIVEKWLIIFLLFFIGLIIFGVDKNSIFGSVSRNNISIWLIVYLAMYYISTKQSNVSFRLIYSVIALIVTVWAGGRSGVFSLALLTLLLYLEHIKKIKNKDYLTTIFKRVFIILCTIFALVVIVLYVIPIKEGIGESFLTTFKYKLSLGIFNDIRFIVIREYLESTFYNLGNFLFGVPYSEVSSIVFLDYNPHNMFINLHASFGIFGLAFISISTLKALVSYLKNNMVYFALLLCILVRGFSDIAGFPGIFDPFVFYFILKSKTNPKKLLHDR